MIKLFYNPFRYIAGIKSLLSGIGILIVTALIASKSNVFFPDIISVKISPEISFFDLILQGLTNILIAGLVFYILATTTSKTQVRFIDIIGTQALARFPYVFAALIGFSNSLHKYTNYILSTISSNGANNQINQSEIIIAISLLLFVLLLSIWMITLMFNAYKTCSNLKGTRLTVSFIAGIILTMIFTLITNNQLFKIL